jgi:Lipocalin-like domain
MTTTDGHDMPKPQLADALVGSWRLVDYVTRDAEGHLKRPFGLHPQGRLIYTASGLMSVQFAGTARPKLRSRGLDKVNPEQERAAFRSYVAYSGRYRMDGGTVIHEVDLSLFPDWVDQLQTRTVLLAGSRLTLRTPPFVGIDDNPRSGELTWMRESA